MRIGLMAVSSSTGLFWPATGLAASLAAQGERTALIAITTPEQAVTASETFRCQSSRWSLYDLSSGACNAGQALMPSGISSTVDVFIEPSATALAMPSAAVARVLDRVSVTHRHLLVVCGGEGWPREAQGWLNNVDHNLLLCPTQLAEIRNLLADGDWPPADTAPFQLWSEWAGDGLAATDQPTPQALAQLLGVPLFGVCEPQSPSSPGQAAELLAAVRRLQQATAAPVERQQQLKARLADTLQRDRAAMSRPPVAEGMELPVDAPDMDDPATAPLAINPQTSHPAQAQTDSLPALTTPEPAATVTPPAAPAAPAPDTEKIAAAVLSIGSALAEIAHLRLDLAGRLSERRSSCRQRAAELQVYLSRFTVSSAEAAVTYDSDFQAQGLDGLGPEFDPAAAAAHLHQADQQARELSQQLAEIDGQAQVVAKLVTNWLQDLNVG